MTTYSPQGVGHMALALLSDGPASFADLAQAFGVSALHKARRKSWYVVEALRVCGFVTYAGGLYSITPEGFEALDSLRAGVAVERPAERVAA